MNRRTFLTSGLAGASLIHSKFSWCDFRPAITEPVNAARRVPEVYLNMRFDNFVVGGANLLAWANATRWAENLSYRFIPLLICGGAGAGKSHLAHAAFNEIVKRNPGFKAHRVEAWDFSRDMEDAHRQGVFVEFMRNYKSLDVLFMDGVQFLSERPVDQQSLQSIFDTLLSRGRQMFFCTDVHPQEMHGFSESLKSRLARCGVLISQPEPRLRRAILGHYALTAGLEIQPEALDMIAARVQSCPRELEGWVKRFSAWSRFHRKPITLNVVGAELQRIGWA